MRDLVDAWLQGIGLGYAVPIFLAQSINTPDALSRIEVVDFPELGISNQNDRKKRVRIALKRGSDNFSMGGEVKRRHIVEKGVEATTTSPAGVIHVANDVTVDGHHAREPTERYDAPSSGSSRHESRALSRKVRLHSGNSTSHQYSMSRHELPERKTPVAGYQLPTSHKQSETKLSRVGCTTRRHLAGDERGDLTVGGTEDGMRDHSGAVERPWARMTAAQSPRQSATSVVTTNRGRPPAVGWAAPSAFEAQHVPSTDDDLSDTPTFHQDDDSAIIREQRLRRTGKEGITGQRNTIETESDGEYATQEQTGTHKAAPRRALTISESHTSSKLAAISPRSSSTSMGQGVLERRSGNGRPTKRGASVAAATEKSPSPTRLYKASSARFARDGSSRRILPSWDENMANVQPSDASALSSMKRNGLPGTPARVKTNEKIGTAATEKRTPRRTVRSPAVTPERNVSGAGRLKHDASTNGHHDKARTQSRPATIERRRSMQESPTARRVGSKLRCNQAAGRTGKRVSVKTEGPLEAETISTCQQSAESASAASQRCRADGEGQAGQLALRLISAHREDVRSALAAARKDMDLIAMAENDRTPAALIEYAKEVEEVLGERLAAAAKLRAEVDCYVAMRKATAGINLEEK